MWYISSFQIWLSYLLIYLLGTTITQLHVMYHSNLYISSCMYVWTYSTRHVQLYAYCRRFFLYTCMHITVRVHVPHMTVFSLLQVYNGLKKKEEQHLVYIYLYFVTPCSYCNLCTCKNDCLMCPPVLYADVVIFI